MTTKPKIGLTGEYPSGKLTPDDKGSLNMRIRAIAGKVLLEFGTEVTWLGMEPTTARALADALIRNAEDAERQKN